MPEWDVVTQLTLHFDVSKQPYNLVKLTAVVTKNDIFTHTISMQLYFTLKRTSAIFFVLAIVNCFDQTKIVSTSFTHIFFGQKFLNNIAKSSTLIHFP